MIGRMRGFRDRKNEIELEVEIEERFIERTALDGAEFLAAQADTFAGANVKEKRRPAPLGMTGSGGSHRVMRPHLA